MQSIYCFSIMLLMLLMTGCGGGGGTGSSESPPPAATKAFVKLNLTGTLPAGTTIIGTDFTITLPASVAPELVNDAVAAGVVLPSGTFAGGTQVPPVYTAATSNAPATIEITIADSTEAGIAQVGEVATVTLLLGQNAAPSSASFAIGRVSVIDNSGNPISGMNVTVSSVTLL